MGEPQFDTSRFVKLQQVPDRLGRRDWPYDVVGDIGVWFVRVAVRSELVGIEAVREALTLLLKPGTSGPRTKSL